MVAKNANQELSSYQVKQAASIDLRTVLKELQDKLSLPNMPMRIEGYDISNNRFSIASSTALGTTDRLVINSSGSVGISSTTPGPAP